MGSQAELERPLQLYAWGYDEDDMDMITECFTEDAVLVFEPDPLIEDAEALGGERRTIGRDAIVEQFRNSRGGFEERGEQPRHLITNVFVEDAGEREADVRCMYLFCVQSASGLDVKGVSRYYDHLIYDGERWRIQVRRNVTAHVGSRRAPAAARH
jgi:hypothetical protein